MQPLGSNGAASFFRAHQHIEGCSFCLQLNHHIRMCPLTSEYVHTGRAKVINDKLQLPNDQRIPNNGSGQGIKAGIDAWLTSQATQVPPQPHAVYAPPPPLPLPESCMPPTACIEEVAKANILQVMQVA